jgi:plasmid replication initiation protein
LHDAQKQVKENTNKLLFYFSLADLKDRAGIHATNNKELKQNLDKLRFVSIETVRENGDWCAFNLLAQVEKKGNGLEIQLPEKIRQALILNDYYTTIDLLTIKNLEGKYAVILYELAMRYHKKQLPELTIEEFKELTGTTKTKSYANTNNLKTYVIEPAIKEINEKTDIRLSYSEIKTGAKTTSLKFKVSLKKQSEPVQENQLDERAAEPKKKITVTEVSLFPHDENTLKLFALLPELEQTEARKKELSELLKAHSFEMLKGDIEYCKKQNISKGFWNYFISSTKKGHYSAEDTKQKQAKEKKSNEIKQKELEYEKRKKEFEEFLNDYCQAKQYELKYSDMIAYEKEYSKQKERMEKVGVSRESFIFTLIKTDVLDSLKLLVEDGLCEENDFENYKDYLQKRRSMEGW